MGKSSIFTNLSLWLIPIFTFSLFSSSKMLTILGAASNFVGTLSCMILFYMAFSIGRFGDKKMFLLSAGALFLSLAFYLYFWFFSFAIFVNIQFHSISKMHGISPLSLFFVAICFWQCFIRCKYVRPRWLGVLFSLFL